MMTADALLWRLKYFLLLVAIFAATSFAPPAAPCAPGAQGGQTVAARDTTAACAAADTLFSESQLRLSDSRQP
jgi:hypothetical protein